MFFCRAYSELRRNWLESLDIPPDFSNLELCQKFKIVLNESSNVKSTAQFIIDFYNKRSKIVNQNVLPNL